MSFITKAGFRVPKVAAAIVTYNHKEPTLQLLERLQAINIPTFITENACSDGTADAIKQAYPSVSLLESPTNLGGCGGFNCSALAALSSGCEYVIFIDDDALPEKDCIDKLAHFLDHHSDYVFAAPAIYIASKPDMLQETGGGVNFLHRLPVQAWNRFQSYSGLPDVIDVDYASACCLMVRSDAIQKIGVMDWAYFIFSDDVDLCLRLRRSAGKGACVTTARAVHDFPWAKPFSPMRLYYFQRNGLRLIATHRQGILQLISLMTALMRLHRRVFYSKLIGDYEIHQILTHAFEDAWHGRYGKWQNSISFPSQRTEIDAHWISEKNIKKVLIDITIEDFDERIISSLHERGVQKDAIDLLCDMHRVENYKQRQVVNQVFGRPIGFIRPLLGLKQLRLQNYDLVITDASMEPRRPSALFAKYAAFFHNGELYAADAKPELAVIAHVLSPIVGVVKALLTCKPFLKPPSVVLPPAEAAFLLEYVGVDPKVGQPWARTKQALK